MKKIRFVIEGGLGNQMFEVAHAVNLASNTGAVPSFLDATKHMANKHDSPRKWELEQFGITGKPINRFQARIL